MDKSYEESLQDNRKKINEIDDKLADLFAKRMHVSEEIGKLKKEFGREILDADREAKLKSRLLESFADKGLEKYYESFIDEILSSSKKIQEKI